MLPRWIRLPGCQRRPVGASTKTTLKWAQFANKNQGWSFQPVARKTSSSPEFLGSDCYSCRKACKTDLCIFQRQAAAAEDIWWALWIELLIHWKIQEKLGKNKSSQFKLPSHFCIGEWNVKSVLQHRNDLVAHKEEWISDLTLRILRIKIPSVIWYTKP